MILDAEPLKTGVWCVVKMRQHGTRSGFLKLMRMGDVEMFQLTVPNDGDKRKHDFLGINSIASIEPCTEEAARKHWLGDVQR